MVFEINNNKLYNTYNRSLHVILGISIAAGIVLLAIAIRFICHITHQQYSTSTRPTMPVRVFNRTAPEDASVFMTNHVGDTDAIITLDVAAQTAVFADSQPCSTSTIAGRTTSRLAAEIVMQPSAFVR